MIKEMMASIAGAIGLILVSTCITAAMIGAGLVVGWVADMVRAVV